MITSISPPLRRALVCSAQAAVVTVAIAIAVVLHRHLVMRLRYPAAVPTRTASSVRRTPWPAPTASGPSWSASRTWAGWFHRRRHPSPPAQPPRPTVTRTIITTTRYFADTAIVANPLPALRRRASWWAEDPSPPSATSRQACCTMEGGVSPPSPE